MQKTKGTSKRERIYSSSIDGQKEMTNHKKEEDSYEKDNHNKDNNKSSKQEHKQGSQSKKSDVKFHFPE